MSDMPKLFYEGILLKSDLGVTCHMLQTATATNICETAARLDPLS